MHLIIHITGPSGSGKTFCGIQLKEKYKKKIIVKDLDDLRHEFIKNNYDTSKSWSFEQDKYQSYIDEFIENNKRKPIIFVGLNDNHFGENKKLYYSLHSQHNYYIDVDDNTVIKQKCFRFLTDELQDMLKDSNVMNEIVNNNEEFLKMIMMNCSKKEIIKSNKKWKKDYTKQGYIFLSSENIYKHITKILNHNYSF